MALGALKGETLCKNVGINPTRTGILTAFDKMGVEYDPSAKYLGRNGKYIGRPERAIVNSCSEDTIYRRKF
jgi:heterodisulfide reductase subunit B